MRRVLVTVWQQLKLNTTNRYSVSMGVAMVMVMGMDVGMLLERGGGSCP